MHFDARVPKPPDLRRARIAADHLLPASAQRQRRGHARAGEADDEERAGWQRWTRLHPE
jgi:hypothetical protein